MKKRTDNCKFQRCCAANRIQQPLASSMPHYSAIVNIRTLGSLILALPIQTYPHRRYVQGMTNRCPIQTKLRLVRLFARISASTVVP